MKNLSLRQIRIFSAAARHLSFVRAAEELHLSAPAVSMQIKELEGEIGSPLFLRSGRKVELTSAGEYFWVYAKKVLSTLAEAEAVMQKLKGAEAGNLKIGLVSTAKYSVPRMLGLFREAHPGIQISLNVCNRETLVSLLRDGEIDLAVMGRPPKNLDTRADVFAHHPHAFIASPQHPLAGMSDIQAEALNHEELISREEGSGTRAIMETYITQHRVSPTISMEMSSNETIKQAVIAGLGISFVSLHTVGLEIAHGQLVVLNMEGTPVRRAWHVVSLTQRHLSPAAEAFRVFMCERGAQLLAEQFPNLESPRL
ncbi:MAG: LysR family transcriptional regulator [Betaproteobacteria bacterium]|nr:LysR family transcriptional regulator [Betaproteobacteria bacterium]